MKKILFSLICALGMSLTAYAETVTLYYVNSKSWKDVNAYVWAGEAYKTWPGEAMTKTEDQVNGFDVYSYTFNAEYINVIFNNGNGTQTSDMVWDAATPYFYENKWYATLKEISGIAGPTTITLYYVNTNKWENVNAYAWYTEGETNHVIHDWPGGAMYKTEDQVNGFDVYSFTFAREYVNVIFNDGGANKTADLTWNAATPYYYGDKWYADLKDIPAPATTVTLYYVNTNKWENVNAYVWADDAYKSWPGEAMTKTGDQVNGFDVYSYTFPADYVNVIFSLNDAVQTADLTWDAATPYYYGDKWYADLKDIPAPASTVTLYYVNTNKWENVNAYAWYTESETNHEKAAWAGEAMTKTGDQVNGFDVYSYTLETEYVNVIFNDGGTNKTADLTWDAATPYYYGDKWYAALKDIPAPATTVTLYYVNTNKWENVNAYAWYTEGETNHEKAAWAGEAMTKTGDQVNGFDVYSYTLETEYVNVIFNDGGANKTADLTWDAATPYYYGDKWYADLKDIPAPATTVTLYYVNTNKWENVNAYAWYTEGETNHEKAAWSGEAMTKTGDQVNGFDVYSYTLGTEYVNVIFNDGGANKTADLTWNAATPYYYGDKWYADLKDIPAPATTVTLYYVNTNKWENVNAYAWYTESETNHEKAAWAGEAMTKTGDQVNGFDVYSYTLETEYVNIIFNDGGTNKTADLTWNAATPYYYGDKWYAALEDIPAASDPTTVTLYYVNTNKWETVNAYVWYKEGETTHEKAAWAGEAMTKTADQVNGFDVYSYTFETEYVNVIFTDGTNQTADLTWDVVAPYYYGDKWYAALNDIPAAGEITRVDYTLLNAGELANDNAKMFVHTWGDGMGDEDILMTAVMDGEAVVAYKAAINDLTQNLVFVRMNPEAEAIDWENNWGKSADLVRCEDSKAYFTGWSESTINVSCDAPTDVEIVERNTENGKVIENGILYILRDGKRYNAQGVEVK